VQVCGARLRRRRAGRCTASPLKAVTLAMSKSPHWSPYAEGMPEALQIVCPHCDMINRISRSAPRWGDAELQGACGFWSGQSACPGRVFPQVSSAANSVVKSCPFAAAKRMENAATSATALVISTLRIMREPAIRHWPDCYLEVSRLLAVSRSPRPASSGLFLTDVGSMFRVSVPALSLVMPYLRWKVKPDYGVLRTMLLSRSLGRELIQSQCW
jgi:hypothetical protein